MYLLNDFAGRTPMATICSVRDPAGPTPTAAIYIGFSGCAPGTAIDRFSWRTRTMLTNVSTERFRWPSSDGDNLFSSRSRWTNSDGGDLYRLLWAYSDNAN